MSAWPAMHRAPKPTLCRSIGSMQSCCFAKRAYRDGKILNVLLKRLTHGAAAPTRKILERALPGTARRSLGRHLSTLNRVATRVTKRPNAKLWRYQPAEDVYAVHPATRTALRELIPVLARSGRSEEPLWE